MEGLTSLSFSLVHSTKITILISLSTVDFDEESENGKVSCSEPPQGQTLSLGPPYLDDSPSSLNSMQQEVVVGSYVYVASQSCP